MKVSLLSYKYPEIKGNKNGVFAKIPHHSDEWNKRYFDTNYKTSYEAQFKETGFQPKTVRQIKNEGVSGGNESGYKKHERIRITSELISEKYKGKLQLL